MSRAVTHTTQLIKGDCSLLCFCFSPKLDSPAEDLLLDRYRLIMCDFFLLRGFTAVSASIKNCLCSDIWPLISSM